jgi:hypothetical protein
MHLLKCMHKLSGSHRTPGASPLPLPGPSYLRREAIIEHCKPIELSQCMIQGKPLLSPRDLTRQAG